MTNNLHLLIDDRQTCVETIVEHTGEHLDSITYTRSSTDVTHGTIELAFTTRTALRKARRRLGSKVEDCAITYRLAAA